MHSYTFRRGLLEAWRWRVKRSLFKRLTRAGMPVFTLGGDVISVNPQVHGVYEPQIMHLIRTAAEEGLNRFFVDVGANIGLISCQAGCHFRRLVLFEPNPQVLPILRANVSRCLHTADYEIREYAIGTSDGVTRLRVPRGNLGGAFIQDDGNSYSPAVLAKKDRFHEVDPRNYDEIEIQVRDRATVLDALAVSLKAQGLDQGVIKLDVEGYEAVVLEGVLNSFKDGFRYMVVMECQSDGRDLDALVRRHGAGRLLQLREYPDRNRSHWLRSLRGALAGGFEWRLEPYVPQRRKTDLVYFSFEC
jgi:FkbM family methyltransferase